MKWLSIFLILIASTKGFCMEFTNGFVLQTEAGQQVGFILGSPSFNSENGDCVFTLLPQEASLVDSELGIAISESKVAGEHQWHRQGESFQFLFRGQRILEVTERSEVIGISGKTIGKVIPLPTNAQ